MHIYGVLRNWKGSCIPSGLITRARDIPQHDSAHKTAYSLKKHGKITGWGLTWKPVTIRVYLINIPTFGKVAESSWRGI